MKLVVQLLWLLSNPAAAAADPCYDRWADIGLDKPLEQEHACSQLTYVKDWRQGFLVDLDNFDDEEFDLLQSSIS